MDAKILTLIDALSRSALVTLLDDIGVPAGATTSRSTLAGLVLDFYLDKHLSESDIIAAGSQA